MLDIRYIRENKEQVQKAAEAKNFKVQIDELLEKDNKLRLLRQSMEEKQAIRNKLSKDIGLAAKDEVLKEKLKQEVLGLKESLDKEQNEVRELEKEFQAMMLLVPQPAAEDVPFGKDDQENVQVKTWGTPRTFDFSFKDHITLGESLNIIDIERGVKIAGSRSYVFKGDGALLEQAILRYSYDYLVSKGFIPMSVPVLVKETAMEGTGYFPIGRDQAYLCERDNMALVGTSEVSLCSMYSQETLKNEELPLKLLGQTPCFRREAGTYGKDTKGLYRVHQFNKIEMVILGHNDKAESEKLHSELLGHAEHILQALELPYRVVYVCTGDLGQGQVRKHDIETWMPSRQNYGETHSCSTFYDFQSRRLDIKYKDQDGQRKLVYTLNNTACATPRLILALLENQQTEDGKILVPKALQPYLQNRTVLGA